MNGDIFTEINYKEILENHKKTKQWPQSRSAEVEDPSRYGVAELAKDNRITKFIEKPPKETSPKQPHKRGSLRSKPQSFPVHSQREGQFRWNAKSSQTSRGRHTLRACCQRLWIDIGKPEEYLQTNKILLEIIGNRQKRKSAGKFELKNPVALDKNVSIGEKSIIGPYAVLGKNVTVGKNVQINSSVIFPDAKIDDSSSITGAIIGEGAIIGKKVKITKGCIIADQAKVKDNISLPEEAAVCPAKEVSENILKSKIIC